MKNLFSLLTIALAAGMISCGGTKYDPNNDPVSQMYDSMAKADSLREWGPPKAITFANAGDTGALDRTRITIEGYIGIAGTLYETETSTSLQLWERKGQNTGEYVTLTLGVGNGNNQAQSMPDKYKKTDLSAKDDKGNAIHFGDRVRITGIYSEPYSDGYGSVDVQSLEKIDDVAIDYTTLGAAPITIDTNGHAALDGKLVVAEGYLEIPSFLSVDETAYFDLRPKAGSDDYLTVDIVVGSGPNMVEEIPDNFAESDIKVRDHKGDVAGKKKVRIYGVWKYDRIAAEFIEIL